MGWWPPRRLAPPTPTQPPLTFGALDAGDEPQRRALGVALVGRRHAELGSQLVGRQRARQVVALGEVATQARELLPDLAVLDALGDDLQAEVVGQLDGRAHDRGVGVLR